MINRDYTKEVGIESGNKTIPRPVAGALLALLAVGMWFAVAEVRVAAEKEQKLREAAVTASAKPHAGK